MDDDIQMPTTSCDAAAARNSAGMVVENATPSEDDRAATIPTEEECLTGCKCNNRSTASPSCFAETSTESLCDSLAGTASETLGETSAPTAEVNATEVTPIFGLTGRVDVPISETSINSTQTIQDATQSSSEAVVGGVMITDAVVCSHCGSRIGCNIGVAQPTEPSFSRTLIAEIAAAVAAPVAAAVAGAFSKPVRGGPAGRNVRNRTYGGRNARYNMRPRINRPAYNRRLRNIASTTDLLRPRKDNAADRKGNGNKRR